MKKNKYNDFKIVWFPEKLNSFLENKITGPIYVRIKPTNKCCHNCWFCVYNPKFSDMHHNIKNRDELPKNSLFDLIRNLHEIDVKAITFSGGGEPLCHPAISEAMLMVLNNKMALSIITNGQFLYGDRASILCRAHWVRISVDYFDEKSFKISRGCSTDMFDKLLKNISNFAALSSKSSDLGINFIINKDNVNHLEKAFYLFESLGIDNIRFSPMWTTDLIEYHSNISETAIKTIADLRKNSKIEVYDSYSNVFSSVGKRTYHKCFFSQMVPVVAADGYLYTCHNMSYENNGRISSKNIKTSSFKDIWFSEETKTFFNTFDPIVNCLGQCSNDKKNINIYSMLNSYGDPFV